MMQSTKIQWTDFSANLLKYRDAGGIAVHACIKCSKGCENCYAETIAGRFEGRKFTLQQTQAVTPFFDETEAKRILRSKKLAGKRVFIDDMTDLFGEWVPDEIIDQHFAVFALRPDVTFQVLTKRAAGMRSYFAKFRDSPIAPSLPTKFKDLPDGGTLIAPLQNVWLGASVEDQATADARIPHLLRTPAAVLFVSYEPAIGQVDFGGFFRCEECRIEPDEIDDTPIPKIHPMFERCGLGERCPLLHWIIVGGESGLRARPFNLAWAQSTIRQCREAGVACFCKQLGSNPVWEHVVPGCSVRSHIESLSLRDRKGGDMTEWPEDLRVREMPQ